MDRFLLIFCPKKQKNVSFVKKFTSDIFLIYSDIDLTKHGTDVKTRPSFLSKIKVL